jgi:glycerophosphoryl diester phosphodiesterase
MVTLRRSDRPIIVAHRGASGYAPENTYAAFDLAVKMGADMIEMDIHPTSDGRLVVIHDDTVDRTTNGHGKVSEMPYEQIRELNAAARYIDRDPEQVPLFSDVLSKYAGIIDLMVEVKHGSSIYAGVEKEVVNQVTAQKAFDYVEIISFDGEALKRIRKEASQIKLGIIFVGNMISFADNYQGQVEALHGSWDFVSREQINYARQRNFFTFLWTANTEEEISICSSYEPDGIVTNFPDRAKQILERIKRT